VIFLSGSTKATAGVAARSPGLSHDAIHQRADLLKIVSVLEKRMGDQKLPDKVRDKLSSLGDAQIRLIASLSDVISHDEHAQGADIAFLLIAALIVLS
jgi:hypothetical protein